MKHVGLLLALLQPPALAAQTIPVGTLLPVRLDTGIEAGHVRAGQPIRARVMQNIPGTPIRRGAHVVGHILAVHPSSIQLRMDAVVEHGKRIPVTTDLRAVASMLAVSEAQIPEDAPSRGLPPEDWNTRQIGGDEVYRGGGPVARGDNLVGTPTAYGVHGMVRENGPCRGSMDDPQPQAFWLFSTDACGVYDIAGLTIAHAGRTAPVGVIQLSGEHFHIRSGSGWLLRVTAP